MSLTKCLIWRLIAIRDITCNGLYNIGILRYPQLVNTLIINCGLKTLDILNKMCRIGGLISGRSIVVVYSVWDRAVRVRFPASRQNKSRKATLCGFMFLIGDAGYRKEGADEVRA